MYVFSDPVAHDTVQIDYNSSNNKVAMTSKKKFRLNVNHGKLSPHSSDNAGSRLSPSLKASKLRPGDFQKRYQAKTASDSGSDYTDIYTTDDL